MFLSFPHIPEQIFEKLNFKSLMDARLVAHSWKQFIIHETSSFKDQIADLKKQCWGGITPFQFVC